MAALLKRADRIHIMVGIAKNEALDCNNVPAIYAYKLHVIRDMINTLRDRGKDITEEYF